MPNSPSSSRTRPRKPRPPRHELYHEIFGSILDRTEMTPYLMLRSRSYRLALRQATRMMGNRGFDTLSDRLRPRERARAQAYVNEVWQFLLAWLLPFVERQLRQLLALRSENQARYCTLLRSLAAIRKVAADRTFRRLVAADPRHLFLLASSRKHPDLFHGYRGRDLVIPPAWQRMACALLKMGLVVKSIEEDSQDVHDYARLAQFLESHGQPLHDLYNFNWEAPSVLPTDERARRAFVKVAAFFHKLRESITLSRERDCLVFNSGDGVEVDILEIKSRLKSPESMYIKLGKSVEGEAFDIRDILAVTFLLRSREDTLTLFHALQKRGVILQENTVSPSITQTLFDSPADMLEAVRRLSVALARSEGKDRRVSPKQLRAQARSFFEALSANTRDNPASAKGHRKFQCKINYSLPIHHHAKTNRILVPGTAEYADRDELPLATEQHTLGVELRITDQESWRAGELQGESHHDAYRFRQLLVLLNRLFRPAFDFPPSALAQLRQDQNLLFT